MVAADADVDAAVEGVTVSAFGFQGQKCSACSRAIVDAKIYDEFVEKLPSASRRSRSAIQPIRTNYMGPVINEAALRLDLDYIEKGKRKEAGFLTGGKSDRR